MPHTHTHARRTLKRKARHVTYSNLCSAYLLLYRGTSIWTHVACWCVTSPGYYTLLLLQMTTTGNGAWLARCAPISTATGRLKNSDTWSNTCTCTFGHLNSNLNLNLNSALYIHWGRDKMDAISQTAFLWMKMFEFRTTFLKFVPKGPINNIPALVRVMAWRRPGAKPLSEPVMVRLPTHICVTPPHWVKRWDSIG